MKIPRRRSEAGAEQKAGLYRVLGPYRGIVFVLIILALAGSSVNLLIPKIIARGIDAFTAGSFDAGTVKTMGDLDSNNFTTYVNIRQLSSTQTSYFSTSGNVTITGNIAHPTESGIRLISGTVNITAASTTDNNTTTMTGSFTELEYEN